MSDWLDEPRILRVPVIRVAFALSLALHAAALWEWLPRLHELSFTRSERDKASGPLVVELAAEPSRAATPPAAPPAEPPAIPRQAQPAPAKRAPQAKATPRPPPPPPPVITQDRPAPPLAPRPDTPPAAAPDPPPVAALAPPPGVGDFYAALEARRRARGAAPDGGVSAPAAEDERQRHNREVAANLGLDRTPTYGTDRTGGGVFRIQRMSSDYAEFIFFGWNKDIRRNSQQLIEVRRGDNPDIRIAVVRRMIAIIRDREDGDFVWISTRLGRDVTLSARPSDNSGLEEFMMQEFFAAPRGQ